MLAGYLADRKPVAASYATLEAAAKAIRRHLGDLEAPLLTKERVRFYNARRRAEGHEVGPPDARRKKPTTPGTITRELVTLRAALRWAEREKWLDRAPHVEVPGTAPGRTRWMSREEAARLLAECRAPHLRLFVLLGLNTGARTGALLALTWDRVDLVDQGRIDFGQGVSNKRRAKVPITSTLRDALVDACEAAQTDFVIERGEGGVGSVAKGFRAAAQRAGLAGVTPHTMRHTAATWMMLGGADIRDAAQLLAMDEATLRKVYGHHHPAYLAAAAAALGGVSLPSGRETKKRGA